MTSLALRWPAAPLPQPLHWAATLAALAAVAACCVPYLPVDETRYASVAWEMWHSGSFLVPLKNGLPYSDKPPLLFWLIHAGWALTGVNAWWPRLISPLFAFLSLLLVRSIAGQLWPGRTALVDSAPTALLGTVLWLVFSQVVMFDILLAFWVLLGVRALVSLAQNGRRLWWGVLGLAVGFGVLTKGPVVLLHLLPPALLAPWWAAARPALGRWYAGVLAAVLIGAGIALLWAVPAAMAGGESYRDAIFLHQTADRVAGPAPHHRPFWWYLALLPFVLFPWSAWPPVYRGLAGLFRHSLEPGVRLALSWALPTLILFSLVSGKQMHYLVPDLPAYALLVARGVGTSGRGERAWGPALCLAALALGVVALGAARDDLRYAFLPLAGLAAAALAIAAFWIAGGARPAGRRVSKLTLGALLLVAATEYWGMRAFRAPFDVAPMANAIGALQRSGRTVAHLGDYSGQYHFAGRLSRPLVLVHPGSLAAWAAAHPDAFVVAYADRDRDTSALKPLVDQPYLRRRALLLSAPEAADLVRSRAARL
jgi:4-amino-4-deoxy-L-arabinose transferase-like glycosyltransferase